MSSALTTVRNDQAGNVIPESWADADEVQVKASIATVAAVDQSAEDVLVLNPGLASGSAANILGGLVGATIYKVLSNTLAEQLNERGARCTASLDHNWPPAAPLQARTPAIGSDASVASNTLSSVIDKVLVALRRPRTALLGNDWPGATGQWAALEATVRSWADLPSDWADDDGRSPPKTVINGALSFIGRARAADVREATRVTVDADGEVGFLWKSDKASASACFLPDGHIVAYASQGDRPQLWKLDQPYDDNLDLSSFFERVRSLF